jgi:acyl-coenzyme A thioesterase PaaI-like protein
MTTNPPPKHFWDIPDDLPTGAWAAKRALAAVVRELVALTVSTDAPAEALTLAAISAQEIVGSLNGFPRRTFKEGFASCKTPSDFAVFADRSTITGNSNPVAPPMTLSMEGDVGIGNVNFDTPFEGVPGCVHGGLIASAFDQVFGYFQVMQGRGGFTGTLSVRYIAPTPIQTPLRIEARLVKSEGRKSFVAAVLRKGGVVTAEAEALFVAVDLAKMRAVIGGGKSAPEEG